MERDAPASNSDHRTASGGVWRLVWRGLRISRSMAIILVLVASLAANAALFVGGVLYNVIDEALESVTGIATATSKQRKEANDLKRRNRHLVVRNRKLQDGMTKIRRKNRQLESRVARLRTVTSKQRKEADGLKRKNRHLVVRNHKLQDGMAKVRGKNRRLESRIARLRTVTSKTVTRSTKAIRRAVATAPGKALPYVGTVVVVGVAALEVKDHCDTIRDMKAIQRESDSAESHSEEEPKFCGINRNKILKRIKMAPIDAWKRSREFLTDLDPIPPEFETRLNLWMKDQENFLRDGWDGLRRWWQGPDKVNGN